MNLAARPPAALATASSIVALTCASLLFGPFCSPILGADSPSSAAAQLAAEVQSKGWIAYTARSPSGDWDICLCRPDGSGVRALTQTPEHSEFSPQFSQDGRKLLYRRMPKREQLDNNRHGEQGELVVANADGSSPVVLGKAGELSWASFSPDASQIASLSITGISFFDLDRRQVVRKLPRKGFFQQMTWSPDGKWLVGVANSFGASWSIARMDVSTGEAAAVNRVDCCTPDWFPDSTNIIFSWRPPGQKANKGYGWTQLWRAAADGTARSLVYAEEGRHVYGAHVSPDGKYVLFTGNIEEDGDPGRGGAPMALVRLADAPIICGESPEFRAMHPNTRNGPVLTLPTGWEPVWIAQFNIAEKNRQAPAAVPGTLREQLRGRGWLVFSARTESGDWDLFTMRPDGSDRRSLTQTADMNETGARFSPDGKRLLYYRMPKSEPVDNNNYGTFELVIANADGSAPNSYGSEFQWASWGPGGTQIACLSRTGIQIINLATRAVVRELPRRGIVSQLVWAPDGRHFVGTANGLGPAWNIGCLNLDSGRIRAVSETERYNCTPDWAPDSQTIVYARGIIPDKPGRAELWSARADGSERRPLYVERNRHIYGACASPDGHFVLFTRSGADLGRIAEIEMAVIPWPRTGEPTDATSVARLDLGPGWEPHWTLTEIRE